MSYDEADVPDGMSVDYATDLFDVSNSIQMNLENVEVLPSNFTVTVSGSYGPGDFPEPSGDSANA
jgi:hypothetical protein